MSAEPVPSLQLPPRESFAVLDGSLFLPNSNSLDIYIDEQWPGSFDAGRRSEGIVTALVMRGGDSPSLPPLSNHHFHQPRVAPPTKILSACEAINALLRTKRAFPVVLQLFTLQDDADKCREAVLSAAVRLLFGLILRGRSQESVTARFFLDRDDYKGYTLSYDPAPVFRAILAQAIAEYRRLFGSWNIGDCEVLDSDKCGAMAYADLLGHAVPRDDSTPSSVFAEWASVVDWPGHLRLEETNVSKLLSAVQCKGSESAAAVLDLLDKLVATGFGRRLLKDIAAGIKAHPTFRNQVLSILEDRYRDKNRNIRQLNSQYVLVREHLLTALPARAPKNLQLLLHALEFHYANHRGSPLDPDVQRAARDYRATWSDLFSANTALAASVNAKLVVHYCDQFDFPAAQAFLAEIVQPEYTRFLDDRSCGILFSTQGQINAITGKHVAADKCFLEAISQFGQMEPELGSPEIRQTSVYRAMSLLDSEPLSAKPVLATLLGNLAAAASRLATASESVSAWDHHLPLRAIYLLSKHRDKEADAAQSAYLRVKRCDWATGDTHPWELIYLYRALLLYTTADESEASEVAMQDLFKTAALICRSKELGKGHGVTLNVICAMINTVAVVTVEDRSRARFIRLARREIAVIRKALPKSMFLRHALTHFESILAHPEEYSAESALKVLPFNYH